ncbi:metallothionein [Chlorogloeopsis sp. ULAP01]|uniref:metallothionein n=1 Tax=Chlorogloeopsis sp. ULAP01 TaxID=3056483 RepID=UPI0025AAEE84|nr:metallothionein [Chlorogloeopsis sp. ULAP01]MDM9383602.1 metallothionein [Chlorogloeopsis sp. ULAP01]
MAATVNQVKCACGTCLCVFSIDQAVMKDGKPYCCEACANSHQNGEVCTQCESVCGCAK